MLPENSVSDLALRSLASLVESPRSPQRRTKLPRELKRSRADLPCSPCLGFAKQHNDNLDQQQGPFQQIPQEIFCRWDSHDKEDEERLNSSAEFFWHELDEPPKKPIRSKSGMSRGSSSTSSPRKPVRHSSFHQAFQ